MTTYKAYIITMRLKPGVIYKNVSVRVDKGQRSVADLVAAIGAKEHCDVA